MKRLALLCCLLLVCAAACAEGADTPMLTDYTVRRAETLALAPGVTWSRYTLLPPDGNAKRGQRVCLIRVAPEALATTRLVALPSGPRVHKGLKPVTTILSHAALRPGEVILGGVNADFFDMTAGGALGTLLSEGEWLVAGEFPDGWACGITEDGRPFVGQPRVAMTLTLPDGSALDIDALNALRADAPRADSSPDNARDARRDNQLVLYTPAFGPTTDTQKGGTEVLLRPDAPLTAGTAVGATVTEVTAQRARGGMALSGDALVLSAVGDKAEALRQLRAGERVRLLLTAAPPFDTAVNIVGGGRPDGGPLLLLDGEALDLSGLRQWEDATEYFYRRHPRTVMALMADGGYCLLVVEGNRSGSYGMTLEQTQTLLTDLGAVTAVNLDGGPSSTMVVRKNGEMRAVTDTTGGMGRLTAVGSALAVVLRAGQAP